VLKQTLKNAMLDLENSLYYQ